MINTVDTTRIPYDLAIDLSIAVSQMQWPKGNMKKSLKVIILVPDNPFHYAFAAASLVHDPIMGNLLFTSTEDLDFETLSEIKRLDPSGTNQLPPIITVGPFAPKVIHLLESMGYPVLPIMGKGVLSTAVKVAQLREQITPQSPDGPISLFVVSDDTPYEGVLATYYATHSGVPILFTHANRLPATTARELSAMSNKHVYIIGGLQSISRSVANEISNIVEHPVRRIAGNNPFETSVEFSRYYDPVTSLGWNRNEAGRGDAFSLGNLNRWDLIVAASTMAHQGKHTPLLLLERNFVPAVVYKYLEYLKPSIGQMHPMPPFMHGFILGSDEVISYETQADIEEAIKIDEQP